MNKALKIIKKAKNLKIYKKYDEAKLLFGHVLKVGRELAISLDNKREINEDKLVELMNKLAENEQYIKLKNKGADALIEAGLKAGIALIESQFDTEINIPEETIDKIADKGGDVFVKVFDKLIARLKKQLLKKSKRFKNAKN
jgi:ribosome-associated translation inhibitor RaiA